MSDTIDEKKVAIRIWLENNKFFNIETNDSIFMLADGISNDMVVMVHNTHSSTSVDINQIKTKSLLNGRQLWKADVIDDEIYWEIL